MRQSLSIGQLRKIEDILSDLSFLGYSTATRNLAYQIQYIEFLAKFWNAYHLYGSVSAIFLKDYTIHICAATEHLLFEGVNIIHNATGLRPAKDKLESLTRLSLKYLVISKQQKIDIDSLRDRRNLTHPGRQYDLDTKIFTVNQAKNDRLLLTSIVASLQKRIWFPWTLPDCVRCDDCKYLGLSICTICRRPLDE